MTTATSSNSQRPFQKAKVLSISQCPLSIYAQTHSVVWLKTSTKAASKTAKPEGLSVFKKNLI